MRVAKGVEMGRMFGQAIEEEGKVNELTHDVDRQRSTGQKWTCAIPEEVEV